MAKPTRPKSASPNLAGVDKLLPQLEALYRAVAEVLIFILRASGKIA